MAKKRNQTPPQASPEQTTQAGTLAVDSQHPPTRETAGKWLVRSIDSLSPDPANARKHGERNLEAIKGSLRRFGQQKPIVIDGDGVVRAGNGTFAAAKALGWTEIGVVVTELAGTEATAFGIADNRAAELAEWDEEILKGFLADEAVGDVGFNEKELAKINQELETSAAAAGPEKFMVVITCRDEAHQLELLARFEEEQLECRALIG